MRSGATALDLPRRYESHARRRSGEMETHPRSSRKLNTEDEPRRAIITSVRTLLATATANRKRKEGQYILSNESRLRMEE